VVLVMVDGRNFFPGTTVAVGQTVHRSAETGLLIKSDYHMQITTTQQALAYGNGVINGRYGPTVALQISPTVPAIWVAWCEVELSADGKFDWLEIYIASADKTKVLTYADLLPLPEPIVTVDERVLPPPYYLANEFRPELASEGYAKNSDPADPSAQSNCVSFSAWVPSQWNPTSARFKLVFPFCGEEYQHAFGISEAEPVFTVSRWARGQSHQFLIAVRGGEFENLSRWSVELDKIYSLPSPGGELLRLSNLQLLLSVPDASLAGCERITMRYNEPGENESNDNSIAVYPLQIPPALAVPKPVVFKDLVEIPAKAAVVHLNGILLDRVTQVQLIPSGAASGTKIDFIVSQEATKISALFTAPPAPGFAELVLQDDAQAEIGRVPVFVKSA
jgi:hypothetical protein